MQFSVSWYIQSCTTNAPIISITTKINPVPFHYQPLPPKPHTSFHHQCWVITSPLSVSVDLTIVNSSHQWNHTICGLLRLGSILVSYFQGPTTLQYMSLLSPFYGWIIFQCMDIPYFVYVLTSWLIFGLLPLFAYHEKYWTFIYKCLCEHKFLFFVDIYPEVKLLGQVLLLCLTFLNDFIYWFF